MIKRVKLLRHNDYEVGYKRPPIHTQFKLGKSGNPKGRPKGTKNLKTDLQEEIHEMVQISESGNTRVISKQRAIVKRTVAKALNGDARATELIMKLIAIHLADESEIQDMEQLLAEDAAILNRYLKRPTKDKPVISRSRRKKT